MHAWIRSAASRLSRVSRMKYSAIVPQMASATETMTSVTTLTESFSANSWRETAGVSTAHHIGQAPDRTRGLHRGTELRHRVVSTQADVALCLACHRRKEEHASLQSPNASIRTSRIHGIGQTARNTPQELCAVYQRARFGALPGGRRGCNRARGSRVWCSVVQVSPGHRSAIAQDEAERLRVDMERDVRASERVRRQKGGLVAPHVRSGPDRAQCPNKPASSATMHVSSGHGVESAIAWS
eukprot:3625644-Rhodomonas_salina.2